MVPKKFQTINVITISADHLFDDRYVTFWTEMLSRVLQQPGIEVFIGTDKMTVSTISGKACRSLINKRVPIWHPFIYGYLQRQFCFENDAYSFVNPRAKNSAVRNSSGARIIKTKSWEKKSNCFPAVRKANAIPPNPINVPPMVTLINDPGVVPFFTVNMGMKKIVRPAVAWKSGYTILLSVPISP